MERHLIPLLLGKELDHPSRLPELFMPVRRNPMAKAGLEMAAWDVYSKNAGVPLSRALGGARGEIESGVAVGLASSRGELFSTIEQYAAEGYRRIKVKIKPGKDIGLIGEIRRVFPDLPLMADANSAYSLQDAGHLRKLDAFNLLMLEQPLDADDIVDHARLQENMGTPICLDESIITAQDARKALELGSCKVINIKIGRVGGLTEARRIHDLCAARGIPVWCGGMLESGVGRAHNIALASLDNFVLPGDISASARYWHRDVVYPEISVRDGKIRVPQKPGIGFEIDREYLASVTLKTQTFLSTGH
jgi:O-succinylbenzoate synthase